VQWRRMSGKAQSKSYIIFARNCIKNKKRNELIFVVVKQKSTSCSWIASLLLREAIYLI